MNYSIRVSAWINLKESVVIALWYYLYKFEKMCKPILYIVLDMYVY